MSHIPNEVADDFPEHADRVRDLKISDPHFARLVHEYHQINRVIDRAESLVEFVEELTGFAMRKTRIRLKDEIYSMLAHADT